MSNASKPNKMWKVWKVLGFAFVALLLLCVSWYFYMAFEIRHMVIFDGPIFHFSN